MATPADRNAIPSASSAVPPADPETLAPSGGGATGRLRPPPTPPAGGVIEVPGYVIEGELGRGGMGVVYKAANVLMNRPEVLKVVNKALLDGHPGSAERFLREIQAAARLDHENVVKAYSVLRVGELLVFAMEYVEGEDLAKVVQRQGPLPVTHACHYISQAAMGLQHAHERGMVHRDIKPHNLILTRRGKRRVVKILDFGLAKAVRGEETVDYLTAAGAMLGTPAFMAPEQATDAANADIRTDIYSLGCTLYHLLTGAPPFHEKSHYAILKAHESAEAPSLTQLRADAPPELATVAAKMLAKNPAERFQQPIDVAKALAPIIKSAASAPTEKPPAHAPAPDPAPAPVWAAPKGLSTAHPAHEKTAGRPPRRLSEMETIVPPSPRQSRTAPAKKIKPPSPPRRIMLLGGLLGLFLLGAVGVGVLFLRWTAVEPARAEAPFDAVKAKQLQQAWAGYLKRPVDRVVDLGDGVTITLTLIPPGKFQIGSPVDAPGAGEDERPQPDAGPGGGVLPPGGGGPGFPPGGGRPGGPGSPPSGGAGGPAGLPGGGFPMQPGGPGGGGAAGTSEDERPQHLVEITRPFYLGVYPVTKGQFAAFVKDANYLTEAEGAGDNATWRKPEAFLGPGGYVQTADDPATAVSWNDAVKFCEWLSKKGKGKCELPTEAQWEYACRAGTQTTYFFGDDAGRIGEYAWYAGNSESHTHPVGMKKPNPWGLYDMSGNVWQWCQDYYGPYSSNDAKDPIRRDKVSEDAHVARGGFWNSNAENCRAAYRFRNAPDPGNGPGGMRPPGGFGAEQSLSNSHVGLRVCFRLE